MNETGRTHNLAIEATRKAAMALVAQITAEATEAGYSNKAIYGIGTALDEALSNAISHGAKNDPEKRINVHYSVSDYEVRIEIEDEGKGSDKFHDDMTQESAPGSGTMLMFAFMTEVRFRNRGRSVTLIKRRDCEKPRNRD